MTVWGSKSTAVVLLPTTPITSSSSSSTILPNVTQDVSSSRMVQCFAGADQGRRGSARFFRRLEKVKFGVPVSEAFSNDIPAILLVLLLKVNKQGPSKKDIWRAPGNQAHVRKLIHVMQHGRLVNIENFSPYTAASVIKKFLTKIPGGIFGATNEVKLFEILTLDDQDKQREAFCRVVSSLPIPSQHLLVLLIGTFRLIADAAESCGLKTSPDTIGVSVAPSLFHSCILDGHRAKMEDIARFHMASKVLSFLVRNFGYTNLFPRENYEFYARITGRTLRVDENWRFSFQYPANLVMSGGGEPSNGDTCCSASLGIRSPRSAAATKWLREFCQTAGVGGGVFVSHVASSAINRSRSSPARVNPFLGVYGELGGSWTELFSSRQPAVPCGSYVDTTNGGGNAISGFVEENISEMKASSCEF